jgi:hypothetical protein
MTVSDVHRDERTLQVENASYRWAFHVFAYGLLLIVIYRSYVAKEAAWDLLALVIVGGTVASAYQWTHDILTRRSAATAVVGAVLAALLAMVLMALR